MKKFNVGIVGYGWAATAHLPAINAGALGQVTRICSARSLDARELSAKHGCALQTGTDYAALLADPDIHVEVFSYGAQSAHPTYAAYEYPTTTTTLLQFKGGTVGKCAYQKPQIP